VEANEHEHIGRVMYYFSVHLLYASMVASAAWVLDDWGLLHAYAVDVAYAQRASRGANASASERSWRHI
jgi:hypothetical protein